MKLGIMYIIGGSVAFICAVMAILELLFFPGAETIVIAVIGRAIFALFLGFYMLPRGLLRIREAKYESQIK